MKRPSTRHCLFGGAVLVAGVVWVLDHLAGDGQPRMAQAAQATAPAAVASVGWEPVADLIGRLTSGDYLPLTEELDGLERDLFLPTDAIAQTLAPTLPASTAALGAAAESEAVADSGFCTRHKLVGVMVGGNPLAVVDERVLTINSDLDGYTLIEVQRDYVVFRSASTGERITLELEQGPKTR